MKKLTLGLVLTTSLAVAGCGVSQAGQPSSNTNTSNNAAQTTAANTTAGTGASDANSTNNTANSSSNVSLVPYTGFKNAGLTLNIPSDWIPTTTTGGDYKAVVFSNPADKKEQVKVLYSTCVGCYMNSSGNPDPTLVISEQQKTNVQVSPQTPLVASYDFSKANNQYQGHGKVQVSSNQSGYAEVDVLLSGQDQGLANTILSSFHFSS